MLKTLMYTLMHVDNPYSTATCANPMLDLLGKHEKKTICIYIYIYTYQTVPRFVTALGCLLALQGCKIFSGVCSGVSVAPSMSPLAFWPVACCSIVSTMSLRKSPMHSFHKEIISSNTFLTQLKVTSWPVDNISKTRPSTAIAKASGTP